MTKSTTGETIRMHVNETRRLGMDFKRQPEIADNGESLVDDSNKTFTEEGLSAGGDSSDLSITSVQVSGTQVTALVAVKDGQKDAVIADGGRTYRIYAGADTDAPDGHVEDVRLLKVFV